MFHLKNDFQMKNLRALLNVNSIPIQTRLISCSGMLITWKSFKIFKNCFSHETLNINHIGLTM